MTIPRWMLPPDYGDGDNGWGGQNDFATFGQMRVPLREQLVGNYNARGLGVRANNVDDDTTALNNAITVASNNGGGNLLLPPGKIKVSAPINAINASNVTLVGAGRWGTIIQPTPSFVGPSIIELDQSNFSGVRDLTVAYAAGPSSASPAATAIRSQSSRNLLLHNLDFQYINGYIMEILGSNSLSPFGSYGAMASNIHELSCAGGIHLQGFSSASWAVQFFGVNINLEGIDGPLDAWKLEDAFDVTIGNLNGAVTQTPNSQRFFYVVGNCASLYIMNADVGALGTMTAPIMQVDSGANGTPKGIRVVNSVLQNGTNALLVNAGTELFFANSIFSRATLSGVDFEGSSGYAGFVNCTWNNNNQSGGTAYELVNNTTGRVMLNGGYMRTVVGAGAGKVTASMSVNGGNKLYVDNLYFDGLGGVPANAFAGSNPQRIANCPNYNSPSVSIPVTVGASPYTVPSRPQPVFYTLQGGTVTALSLGGVALNPATTSVLVPPTTSFVITHSGAPTVAGVGM